MNSYFPTKLYNHIVILFIYVLLTNLSCHAWFGINMTHVKCVESERHALLQFKHDIGCGLLKSWGDTPDCCLWDGIHCNNHSGHVTGLSCRGNQVWGSIPATTNGDYDYFCLEGTFGVSLFELKHLKYLDLSFNTFQGQIPKFIGSLSNLEHLNLSSAGFTGVIPREMMNLSRLSSLDLSQNYLKVESLWWLSHLRLLREVDLSGTDLSVTANTWLSIVNNLPFLQILRLDDCGLSLKSPFSISYINSSSTLRVISLSNNNLNDTSIFGWLSGLTGLDTNLVYLDLSSNQMFGNSLQLSGRAVKFIGNLCKLQALGLSFTNLNCAFSDIIPSVSTCPHKALVTLYLDSNRVWGSIPDNINSLSSLRELYVDDNKLNGSINSQALAQLTMLEVLSLDSNSLKGVLSDVHLSNFSKLRQLTLSGNTGLVINISVDWVPPFQLKTLHLSSCKVGPNFPKWILTQNNLEEIDISNADIWDIVPHSFWNSSFLSRKCLVNMSDNMLYGTLPDVSINFESLDMIDLSSNNLEGAIPTFVGNPVYSINLSNNKFTKGLVPLLCSKTENNNIHLLYLSNNSLSEEFPDCWSHLPNLIALHLDNNRLWGNLPTSVGMLNQLVSLQLRNNKLSGSLPMTLTNCSSLVLLDLAYNSFTRYIPPNFGHSFTSLAILSLRNNHFSGSLPSSLCHLSQLQILDLSENHFSGIIPRCIYKLKGMTNTNNVLQNLESDLILFYGINNRYLKAFYTNKMHIQERVMWKRKEQTFGGNNSIGLLKGIDISDNELHGEIPEGISSLIGIKFLNLSSNNLSGAIMSRIGELTSLESLDLSHNCLSGKIPASLVDINFLGVLDFSFNNLSGKIPTSTQLQSFNASSYMGNPGLCGAPLPKCYGDETPINSNPQNNIIQHKEQGMDELMQGLYISVVLGIIVGFWGVCGTLIVKTSWRHAYFRFYEDTKDRVYVMFVVNIAGAWRRS